MDDLTSIIVSFIVGVIITIFTITYTLKESDRWRVNQCIESIATEINFNKTKFILIKRDLEETKKQWIDSKTISKQFFNWNDEILITEQGKKFVPFKFDAFNYYKNSGIPWIVGIGLYYRLTELYGASKEFNYDVAESQNKIQQYYDNQKFDLIELEFKKLDEVFEKFVRAFTTFANCLCNDLEYVDFVKIVKANLKDWHLHGSSHPDILFSDTRYYK